MCVFFFFPQFLDGVRVASIPRYIYVCLATCSQILYVARAQYIWMCPHPRQKNWFLFAISRLFFQIKGIYNRIFPFLPTQKKKEKKERKKGSHTLGVFRPHKEKKEELGGLILKVFLLSFSIFWIKKFGEFFVSKKS